MTRPRLAGALRRAPILPERHPDWTAPRLLRKAEPTGRQSVPPPYENPVPPPRKEFVPAPPPHSALAADDSIRNEPERQHLVVPSLASPPAPSLARPSLPPAAARAGLGRLVSLLIICVLGVATGLGAAYVIVRMSPGIAEGMTASIDSAVSRLGAMRATQATAEPQARGSATIVPLPAPPAIAGNAELETLLQRAQGELAERQLERPPGDNALDSYRQLKAKWPEEKRVVQLGGAIGLAFWSLGKDAQSTGDWNTALHYFEVVNSLPPLPLGVSPPPADPAAQ